MFLLSRLIFPSFRQVAFPGALAAVAGMAALALAAPEPAVAPKASPVAASAHRSPADVAVSPDGRWALTANQSAGTVSLVDLETGLVASEVRTGDRPTSVAFDISGRQAVVTNTWSGTLSVLMVDGGKLRKRLDLPVGPEPRGVALTRGGGTAYVASTISNEIVVLDLPGARVRARVPVGERPWHLALSPDERWLVVGNTRSRDASVVNTAALAVERTVRLAAENARQVSVSPDGKWAYVPHLFQRGFPTTQQDIERGWVLASRVSRIPIGGEEAPKEALALDPRGKAVGDPYASAVSPDGQWLAVSASSTHEVLLYRLPLPFVAFGGPGDFIESELLQNNGRFRRVRVGGRPMGLRFTADSRLLHVANYLGDSLQTVDVSAGKLLKSIDLGRPAQLSAARRGEAIFHDAERSFNQWFSCGSCHVDGHTNGLTVDTENDGQYGNGAKKTVSLRGVVHTGPWTWHGWQKSLTGAMENSLSTTLHGPKSSPQDSEDLVAFLGTLAYPPNPNRLPGGRLTPSAKRGEQLFQGDAACINCHAGPHFTSDKIVDVGLGHELDKYPGFNPPSLLGLHDKAPYLHDGRAGTLKELLTKHHTPEKLGARRALTSGEIDALIDYLNSL